MNIPVLQQMEDIFSDLSPRQLELISEAINNYVTIFNSNGKIRGLKKMYAITDFENISSDKEATCRKGCAFCCHIKVVSTLPEAELIVLHCQQNNIQIDTNKLEQVQDLNEDEYMFSPHKRCTFLAEDNTCKIYEVRPFACRNHHLKSDPELCNTDTNPHGHVAGIMNIPASLPAAAVMNKNPLAPFAKQLLKALK